MPRQVHRTEPVHFGFAVRKVEICIMGGSTNVKISVVIITFNEEKNIGRCIDSVKEIADEVLVVDSFSSDATQAICLQKGARFMSHPFISHMHQKNFALQHASFPYILSLDADEYLSDRLIASVKRVKQNWRYQAYRMNRLSNYGGKWIRHGNWYPDQKIRLWNRNVGLWGGENPHEEVMVAKGTKVKHLRGDILHYATKDTADALSKIQQYSRIFAREYVGRKSSSVVRILSSSTFAFFKSYVLKRGFLDGFEGLMVAITVANHAAYKYAKLYEANKMALLGKHVIISRTDNLGDVILTLPLVGYLKSVVPGLKITFMGKAYTQSVIERCAYVDQFVDCEEVLRGETSLSTRRADSILFVYPHRELARLAKRAGIPVRVSTSHRWYNWLYCTNTVGFSRINSQLHESQLNFKLLTPFRLTNEVDLNTVESFYGLNPTDENFSHLMPDDKFNLILHPKSKGSAREWPLSHYNKLVERLPRDKFRIFITGLREEGMAIESECPSLLHGAGVHNMIGKFTLTQLTAFISKADGLLACSTGVLHLAAALGKHAIGIYAPMRPIHPGRWKPVGPNAAYLALDKKCSDCRNESFCACINSISVDAVESKIWAAYRTLRRTESSLFPSYE